MEDTKKNQLSAQERARTAKEVRAEDVLDIESTVSSTECTGLMPTPPIHDGEAESYTQLYSIPQTKEKVDNGLQHD